MREGTLCDAVLVLRGAVLVLYDAGRRIVFVLLPQ
jgi:hypothetical protein